MSEPGRCGGCWYFSRGFCHRYPPVILPAHYPPGMLPGGEWAVYPTVGPEDWCGEWRARDE